MRNRERLTGGKREEHSPTVMDSGRPDVGSTVESGAGCVNGLDSMLKHKKRGILTLLEFSHNSFFVKKAAQNLSV